MLKSTIRDKLENLVGRHEEVASMLADQDVFNDQEQFKNLSVEYAQLGPVVDCFNQYQQAIETINNAREMQKDQDPEIRALAEEESQQALLECERLEDELQRRLLPSDPHDQSNIFLEIRAGTGGDEAAIFAGDLYRMYLRYAETRHWQVELLSENAGEHGGYKEVIARIIGDGAYSRLKFESGAHRVQRVPETESQGRIHTSACTVAILPELSEIDEVELNPSDLRIDTYRASGAGGQHVNKTDSAVRLTHLPTGIVVECQDERSQHKNKARAMSLLKSKMLDQQRNKQINEQAQTRRNLVGSGDRSERIRTYNYPQGRITDHRINLTLYKLDDFMTGALDQVIDPLISEYQADQLALLAAESALS